MVGGSLDLAHQTVGLMRPKGFGSMGTGPSLARHQRDLGEQVHRIVCPRQGQPHADRGTDRFHQCLGAQSKPKVRAGECAVMHERRGVSLADDPAEGKQIGAARQRQSAAGILLDQ
jgi:hypothetical protein